MFGYFKYNKTGVLSYPGDRNHDGEWQDKVDPPKYCLYGPSVCFALKLHTTAVTRLQ